jgi:Spy/CpxP family protein refolding chaperone
MKPDRQTLHAGLGMASLVVIGIVVGVTLDRTVLMPGHAVARPAATLDPAAEHRSATQDLIEHLDLNAAQVDRVEEVFSRHQAAVHDAWQTARDRLNAVVDSATVEIAEVLDSAQIERFHDWVEERHGTVPARLHDLGRRR